MTGIVLQSFAGVAPKLNPKNLSESMATIADNVRLDRGVLEPLKSPVHVENLAQPFVSIYPYNNAWIGSQNETDYVGSLLPNDVRQTIFYSDTDYPKMRSSTTVYRLGLPIPSTPSVSAPTAGDDTRSYVITLVDDWGFESAPSAPTASYDVEDGSSVTLTLPSFPAGNYNFGANARVRVYRTNTGSSGAVYQYVGEIISGQGTWPSFVDNVLSANLQEALVTEEWVGPPDDDSATWPDGPLQGMISTSSGALCGFTGNTVHFSEPYLPYAWPVKYQIAGEHKIVSLVETAAGIVVGTTGAPWLIVGSHPDSMARVELSMQQACVSKRSMVDMGDYAIYASPDGLVMLTANDPTLVTAPFFSREEWQALQPETIKAFLYEDMYIAFYGDPTEGKGFIYAPRNQEMAFSFINGFEVYGGYTLQETGQLFLITETGAQREIREFNEGLELTYKWRSKEFVQANRMGFTICRVEADEYPVSVSVYADGELYDEFDVYNDLPVRIRAAGKRRVWQIEISGTSPVVYAGIWDSMAEVV